VTCAAVRRDAPRRARRIRPEALEALRELTLRGESVALLLADHRMPGMTGVDFLERRWT
jgi:thioredoxin reductase (NADPH)